LETSITTTIKLFLRPPSANHLYQFYWTSFGNSLSKPGKNKGERIMSK